MPDKIDGKSFWPVIDEADTPHRDHLYLERNYHGEKLRPDDEDWTDLYDPIRAIRTPEHLYIRHFRPGAWPGRIRPEDEHYDLLRNPHERSPVDDPHALPLCRQLLAEDAKALGDFVPGDPPPRPEEPGWGPKW